MKFDGEASFRVQTEETGPDRQESVIDPANDESEDLARLGVVYRVDNTDKVPSAPESAITIDVHEEQSVAMSLQAEIATLESDVAVVEGGEALPVSQAEVLNQTTGTSLPETPLGALNMTKSEVGASFSPKELRERYDGVYRSYVAKEAWEKRGQQRENREEGREKYGAEAEADEIERVKANVRSRKDYYLQSLDQQIADMKRQTESSLDYLNTMTGLVRQDISLRNPLSKLIALGQKYSSIFGVDEKQVKIDGFEVQRRELLAQEAQKNAELQSQIEQIKLDIRNQEEIEARRIKVKYSDARERIEGEFDSGRKNLFESIKAKNQGSRLASERTAELMAEGKLNVSELAKTSNSLVVHTLPLEGWSMNNTSMNNTEINADEVGIEDKIKIVAEKKPDLSVSIIAIDNPEVSHGTMYPFGLIVDGVMIASYDGDSSTITKGDKRYRKYVGGSEGDTLQVEPQEAFKKNARELPGFGRYNEAIVHSPNVKGIFIDGGRLTPVISSETGEPHDYFGDRVTEIFNENDGAEIVKKYGEINNGGSIELVSTFIPKTGIRAGQSTVRIVRKRSGEQKALEFAQTNYPNLPIYIRRADGVYDMSGQKVSAEDIYADKAR